MTKERLLKQIKRVGEMTRDEILAYRTAVSVSSAPMRAKKYLYEACDVCLETKNRGGAMVSFCEFLEGEVE